MDDTFKRTNRMGISAFICLLIFFLFSEMTFAGFTHYAPKGWLKCSKDPDWILEHTDCWAFEPINKKYLKPFREKYAPGLSSCMFSGPIPKMDEYLPKCLNNLCTAVPKEPR